MSKIQVKISTTEAIEHTTSVVWDAKTGKTLCRVMIPEHRVHAKAHYAAKAIVELYSNVWELVL
jgi:hypothetical protein